MPTRSLAGALSFGCLTLLSLTACTSATTSLGADGAAGAADALEATVPVRAPTVGATCIPLTGDNPPFTAPSWGNGIVFEAHGFSPNASVMLVLVTVAGASSPGTYQTHMVSTDGSGNLGSVWSPPAPPQKPDSADYPRYSIFAEAVGASPVLSCPADVEVVG